MKLDTVDIRFFGLSESKLNQILSQVLTSDVHYLIKIDRYELVLELRVSKSRVNDVKRQVLARLRKYFTGYGSNSIEQTVGQRLIKRGLSITGAESLTAGMFQSTLGNVPGISAIFPGGFITYSNEAKHQLLSIPTQVINKYGVVSEQVAKWMAERSRQIMKTDLSVSFTGVAGPASLENHPAGTVWIGLAVKGRQPKAHLYHLRSLYLSLTGFCAESEIKRRSRDAIRLLSVKAGLKMIEDELNRSETVKRE